MRLSNNQKEILKMAQIGLVFASVFVSPKLTEILLLNTRQKKYRYKKNLKLLEEKGIIYMAGERIKLTELGLELLETFKIDELMIIRPEIWDKVWHLVSYDIPESKKKERDYFRHKLIKFGFYQIQDSLWVIPYECKEQIAILTQSCGISPHVAYLKTDFLPGQARLVSFFQLDQED